MKVCRPLAIALLAVAAFATPAASRAAATTNFSDQWWIETESGWGASVLQQWDTLFIDLFVYGSDNRPTWFTGAATLQSGSPAGHTVFTGDLNATTGPYFGGGTFNPGQVTVRKVGTITFDATSTIAARLTYSVDGATYVKDVTRQLWRFENLSGSYRGAIVYDQTGCGSDEHVDEDALIAISHAANNAITFTITQSNVCTVTGTYTQSGHLGFVANAGFSCPPTASDPAIAGTLNIVEIERNVTGFTARFNGTVTALGVSCSLASGRIGGIRR